METIPKGKLKRGSGIVLSLNGAFNPPHLEHVSMMEEAKRIAEAKGFTVLGGYLSPSSNKYLHQKKGRWAAPLDVRARMCAQAVLKSDWLMSTNLGIPSQSKTARTIEKEIKRPVYRVMGSDVAERMNSCREAIVVPRPHNSVSSSKIIQASSEHRWEDVSVDLDPNVLVVWREWVKG